jgi:hypothetical protein
MYAITVETNNVNIELTVPQLTVEMSQVGGQGATVAGYVTIMGVETVYNKTMVDTTFTGSALFDDPTSTGFNDILSIRNNNVNLGIANLRFSSDATYYKAAIGLLRQEANGKGLLNFYVDNVADAAHVATTDLVMSLAGTGLSLYGAIVSTGAITAGNTGLASNSLVSATNAGTHTAIVQAHASGDELIEMVANGSASDYGGIPAAQAGFYTVNGPINFAPNGVWKASISSVGLNAADRISSLASDYQFGLVKSGVEPWYLRNYTANGFAIHLNGTGDIVTMSNANVVLGRDTSVVGQLGVTSDGSWTNPGVAASGSYLYVAGTNPATALVNSTHTANNRMHEFIMYSDSMIGRFVSDIYDAATPWLTVNGGHGSGVLGITLNGPITGTSDINAGGSILAQNGTLIVGSSSKMLYLRTVGGYNRIDSYDNPITTTQPMLINASSLLLQIADSTVVTIGAGTAAISGSLTSSGTIYSYGGAIIASAATGYDRFRLISGTAGNGSYIDSLNESHSDYEPIRFRGELVAVDLRNGVGSVANYGSWTTSGIFLTGSVTASADFITTGNQFIYSSNGGAGIRAGWLLSGSTGEVKGYIGGNVISTLTGNGWTTAGQVSSTVASGRNFVAATTSGDILLMSARTTAGEGAYIEATNAAVSDYEPLNIFCETFSVNTRTGFGTVAEAIRVHDPATSNAISIYGNRYLEIGPNSSWGAYLRVGGNGNTDVNYATIAATDGNLHIDSKTGKSIYLGFYVPNQIFIGSTSNWINPTLGSLRFAGSMGLGADPVASSAVNIQTSPISEGVGNGILIQPFYTAGSLTYGHIAVNSYVTISGAAVVPTVYGFLQNGGNITGGATVTNFIGFQFNQTDVANAVSLLGFRSVIAAGTNRWNLFMDGTAANYIAGATLIGTTSTVNNEKLHVVQATGSSTAARITGTAASLTVDYAGSGGNYHDAVASYFRSGAGVQYGTIDAATIMHGHSTYASSSVVTSYVANGNRASFLANVHGVEAIRMMANGSTSSEGIPAGAAGFSTAVGPIYFAPANSQSVSITTAGIVISSNTNNSIELGYTGGSATTPFIDFHSGATAVDYDARIIASGGTGANAGATLSFYAATHGFFGNMFTTGNFETTLLATKEYVGTNATALTGAVNFDVSAGSVQYRTTNTSANWTLNFRYSSGLALNSAMAVDNSYTVTLLAPQGGTAYYPTAFTIDGNSVTPKWLGGAAPTAGSTSSIDAYTFTIIKTASATFTVLASAARFA